MGHDKDHLKKLLEQAKERVAAMSPEEYHDMMEEQKKSFVRAMTTPCEHGVLDFEDCPECWEKYRENRD